MNTEPLNGAPLGSGFSSPLTFATSTQLFRLQTGFGGAVKQFGAGTATLALVGAVRATRTTRHAANQTLQLLAEARYRTLVSNFASATQPFSLKSTARALLTTRAGAEQAFSLGVTAVGNTVLSFSSNQTFALDGTATGRIAVRGVAQQPMRLVPDVQGYDLTTTPAPLERTANVAFVPRFAEVTATYSTAEV